MLILLLLSTEDDKIIANILYENVRTTDIRDTLHLSIRKLLNESINLKINAKNKLFNSVI